LICPVLLYGSEMWVLIKREENQLLVFERKVSKRYPARKSKMLSTGGGTTTNSIKSLTGRMPSMPRRQADCATLVTRSEYPKTYPKKLYSEPNSMEEEIKEDRNPGGQME
jgi:shikimate kinase